MTALDTWLKQATRHLSKDSVTQVRSEILEHYDSARDAAIQNGATADEADRLAVRDLGNAKKANRQYREVLLTSDEAKMLREGNWEARAVCSRPWLKWMLLAMPLAALFAAATLFFTGSPLAWPLFAGGTGIGLLFAAPFLPIYTPSRGRVFRVVKWVVLLSMFGLAFGKDSQTWLWLGYSFLWLPGSNGSVFRFGGNCLSQIGQGTCISNGQPYLVHGCRLAFQHKRMDLCMRGVPVLIGLGCLSDSSMK